MLIEWRKEFESGLDATDYEHAQLLDRINAIYNRLARNPAESAVRETLSAIYAEIALHFAHEEKAMQARGYDQYADHKADHEALLGELRDIMTSLDSGLTYDYERALMGRLIAWFAEHFKAKDARFHEVVGRPARRLS